MKKLFIPLFIGALLLTGCGQTTATGNSVKDTAVTENTEVAEAAEATYQQITMDEAAAVMEKETDFILLDVRTKEEFAEGHIPNAINVPNETISDTDPVELPEKDQKILVYCRSGNRSKQAADKLVKLGYTNIIEIGGINQWQGEIVTE